MGGQLGGILVLVVPAIVGIGALAGAFALLSQPRPEDRQRSIGQMILIGLLFLIAFGIGTCYALVFGSGLTH